MNWLNSFLSWSLPAGRIAGIAIRIHILFFLYVAWQLWDMRGSGLVFGAALLAGLYVCILLHEFGHSLSARWCGGDSDEILIWPLGGLAYCRPPLHPTPHLISTVCGPLVTLVLWGLLSAVAALLQPATFAGTMGAREWTWLYSRTLGEWNLYLLLFNLIPAFPLDGGRIVRDTLWHFIPAPDATRIARIIGIVACTGIIFWGFKTGNSLMIAVACFALFSGAQESANFAWIQPWQIEPWSLRERLRLYKRPPAARTVAGRKGRLARDARDVPKTYEPKIVPRPELSRERTEVTSVDHLLDKIARDGIASLTAEERRLLEKASADLRRDG